MCICGNASIAPTLQVEKAPLHLGFFGWGPFFFCSKRRGRCFLGDLDHALVISLFVGTGRPARWILLPRPGSIPQDSCRCATCYGGPPGHGGQCSMLREELFKQLPVEVRFLRLRGVMWEGVLGVLQHGIAHLGADKILDAVDPANPVWKIRALGSIKGFADHPLLDPRPLSVRLLLQVDHLFFGINVHGNIEEVLVKEGHSRLQPPGGRGFVSSEAVVHVKHLELAACFAVEFFPVRRFVEVEISTKHLIAAFPAQDHLDSRRFDLPRHEEHGSGGTNGGHIVGLRVIDHVRNRIDPFLKREVELVVDGTQEIGHFLSCFEVWRAFHADAKGVKRTPPVLLYVTASHGGHQGGVEPSRQQNPERYIAHQSLLHGSLKGVSEDGQIQLAIGEGRRICLAVCHPLGVVKPRERFRFGGEVVSRGEMDEVFAVFVQRLHFGRDPDGSVLPPSDVERRDSHVVPGDEVLVCARVQQHEGEHAVEHAWHIFAVFFVEVADDLAVAVGGEGVFLLECIPQLHVIVDLSVDGHYDFLGLVVQRLVSGGWIHDGQSLVRQEHVLVLVYPAPVGSAVPQPGAEDEDPLSHGGRVVPGPEDGQDATHDVRFAGWRAKGAHVFQVRDGNDTITDIRRRIGWTHTVPPRGTSTDEDQGPEEPRFGVDSSAGSGSFRRRLHRSVSGLRKRREGERFGFDKENPVDPSEGRFPMEPRTRPRPWPVPGWQQHVNRMGAMGGGDGKDGCRRGRKRSCATIVGKTPHDRCVPPTERRRKDNTRQGSRSSTLRVGLSPLDASDPFHPTTRVPRRNGSNPAFRPFQPEPTIRSVPDLSLFVSISTRTSGNRDPRRIT
eukprot:scaffold1204_cov313-Pavlova_lutheri.AAC.8